MRKIFKEKKKDEIANGSNKDPNISAKKKAEKWVNNRVVPFLQVIAANKFLRSLMSGFYTTLPIIIFSSIIGIIMWVPPALINSSVLAKGGVATRVYPLVFTMALNRIFTFTMGMVSLFFCIGITRTMAEKINETLPVTRRMNTTMVMFGSIIALFTLSITGEYVHNVDGSITENYASVFIANLGAQGMITGIIVGLSLPWLFSIPVRFGWTIKLPKAVPQGVSQSFEDIIPIGFVSLIYLGFGEIFIQTGYGTFTDALFAFIKPIFSGLDSYGFLIAVSFMTAFIWFIGVHGPSVTRPFLTAFMYTNLANNQELFYQGKQATWALTYEFSYDFTATLGGTGATFVVPTLLVLFAKSKQLKAVGLASYIPIWFQVNEPALFGCPLILNPIVFPAFIIAPILNIIVYKMMIVSFGMNGAIFDVPWSIPALLGLEVGTGFQGFKPFLLWSIMVIMDMIIWLPFLVFYDRVVCGQEITECKEKNIPAPVHFNYFTMMRLSTMKIIGSIQSKENSKTQLLIIKDAISISREENKKMKIEQKASIKQQKLAIKLERKNLRNNSIINKENIETKISETNVINEKSVTKDKYYGLVVCYGAGSSAIFANSVNTGAAMQGIKNIEFISASYGNHKDYLKDMDVVVFSPQTKVYSREIETDTKGLNSKIVFTNAKEYIQCSNDPKVAIENIKIWAPNMFETTVIEDLSSEKKLNLNA